MTALFVSEGIAATYEINWDDPLSVGIQKSSPPDGPWCHQCMTGNHWTRIPFLGFVWLCLDICWWCNGPMEDEKPVRTQQRMDPTITETHLEPLRNDDRDEWEAYLSGEHERIFAGWRSL